MTPVITSQNCFPRRCPLPDKPINTSAKNIARKQALFEDICWAIKPQDILEVGSWMGASAIAWKQASSVHREGSKVYCIDTWLGSPEHYLSSSGEWDREKLSINDKGPQFFEDFLANIHGAGYESYILPMRADSQSALSYLSTVGASYDLIYIDGAHDEISVFRDITIAHQLIREGGIICGDDFNWSSVRAGLLLAKLDISTPRINILYKGLDFAIVPNSNKCLINKLKSRGYLKWRPWKEFAGLAAFTYKKLIQALRKL